MSPRNSQSPVDPFEALGLDETASEDRIKHQYRQLAKKYHPDHNPGNRHAENKFKTISEAYAVLRNSDTRLAWIQVRQLRRAQLQADINRVHRGTPPPRTYRPPPTNRNRAYGRPKPKPKNPIHDLLFFILDDPVGLLICLAVGGLIFGPPACLSKDTVKNIPTSASPVAPLKP